jgi:antitoxin HigA-1
MFKIPDGSDPALLHPGEILRDDLMPHLGLTRPVLANALGISDELLGAFLSEKCPVTHDLAERLGEQLGNGARYWLALQMQYDLWMKLQSDPTGAIGLPNWLSAPRERPGVPLRQ